MGRYDYIADRYGIRPQEGERVREASTKRLATVCREHRGIGHYVRIRYADAPRRIFSAHPRSLVYLDRPAIESKCDPQWGYAVGYPPPEHYAPLLRALRRSAQLPDREVAA